MINNWFKLRKNSQSKHTDNIYIDVTNANKDSYFTNDAVKNANFLFLIMKIPENFGGLQHCILRRCKDFANLSKLKTTILTTEFHIDKEKVYNSLVLNGRVNPDYTKILNMYDYYKGNITIKNIHPIERKLEEPGCTYYKKPGKNAYRFFKNGMYFLYKSFERPDGKLKFIDYLSEYRYRTKREEFDEYGRILKVTYYDYVSNLPIHELYYDENFRCYLSKWFKIDNGNSVINQINWFNEQGEVIRVFKNDDELIAYWLDQLTSSNETYFLVVEKRPLDKAALMLNKPNVYRTFMLHNRHTKDDNPSVIKRDYKTLFNNLNKIDKVIVLTNEQKNDITQRFGHPEKFYVLPHTYEVNQEPSFKERDLSKVVLLSRLADQKQIDHAIRAFRIVCDDLPDKRLEIYGAGKEEAKLKKLINELNLQNNVFLMGYATNINEIYSKSALSLLTSRFEGFALVILESLANGCPVVSYNIKYGPTELIQDGRNGYLVNYSNINEMAQQIIKLLKNKNLLEEFSHNAFHSAKKYDLNSFMIRWSQFFESLLSAKSNH
jgi:poly(glycerol-phosphate) alpha-glucosyltransferase